MKRFFLVLALTVVMLGVMLYFAPKPFTKYVVDFPEDSTVFVYCRKTSLEATDMGNGFLVQCSVDKLFDVLTQCDCVDGISVRFNGNSEDFLLWQQRFALKTFGTQQMDNLTVVCGNSGKIRGGILLDGRFVNLQMAFDGQTITVGYPLILDSY